MEYHCNKDKQVAFKIYEVGLKTFGNNPRFVASYMEFLMNTTDDANIRSLFERSATAVKSENAQELWREYMRYENEFGDLDTVISLENRFADAYRNGNIDSSIVCERYTFSDLNDVLEKELGKQPSQSQTIDSVSSPAPVTSKPARNMSDEMIILPTTKEEEFLFDAKKKALYSVGKNKFPKMDISGMITFTPDPDREREIEEKRNERSKDKRKREQSPSPHDKPQKTYQPSPPSQVRIPDHAPHFQPLHPALVNFFNQLPPPHMYNGIIC